MVIGLWHSQGTLLCTAESQAFKEARKPSLPPGNIERRCNYIRLNIAVNYVARDISHNEGRIQTAALTLCAIISNVTSK